MTRKKVKLAYIANDSARKATFKKRKKGLMKKVNELSTLCGIEACAVVYSPYESQPEVWPSQVEARQVAAKFKGLPEMEQSKKMVNQESYLKQRITKATEQLKKQRKDNREKDITQVMFQSIGGKSFHNLNVLDFSDLEWVIDDYLKDVGHRMDTLQKQSATTQRHPVRNVGTSNVGDHHQVARGPLGHPDHNQVNLEAAMQRHHLQLQLHPHLQLHQQEQLQLHPHLQLHQQEQLQLQPQPQRHQQEQLQLQPQQQPSGWFMDLMNSQEEVSGHGGLGVGGVLGDEMMLPFGDTNNNNMHINGSHWSGAFFP